MSKSKPATMTELLAHKLWKGSTVKPLDEVREFQDKTDLCLNPTCKHKHFVAFKKGRRIQLAHYVHAPVALLTHPSGAKAIVRAK